MSAMLRHSILPLAHGGRLGARVVPLLVLVWVALLCAVPSCVYSQEYQKIQQVPSFVGYHVVIRSGDGFNGGLPVGTLVNSNMQPVLEQPSEQSCSEYPYKCTEKARLSNPAWYDISPNPDFESLHLVDGQLILLSHFENPNPAQLYVTLLDQRPDGTLVPTSTMPTDWSAEEWQGLWTPCAGSKSPWGTHLGGEEYEPDAYCVEVATSLNDTSDSTSLLNCTGSAYEAIAAHMRFWDYYENNITLEAVKQHFNPYNYGHGFEVVPLNAGGDVRLQKWYTVGRISFELWHVMPDNKTVYATDDGANTAFWKFVMDTPGDLSAGTLYGAKMNQLRNNYGGAFNIDWIRLGHGRQDELLGMVMNNITFSDIFEYQQYQSGCPAGFRSISKRDNALGASCLRLKPGMETAAAFLESRRYLAYLGGTVEFSKMEGFDFDPASNTAYLSLSVIRQGMEDNKNQGTNSTRFDEGGSNDLRIPYNPCGCIYAVKMDEQYNAYYMQGQLCGVPSNPNENNTCDFNAVSEPDNLIVLPGMNSLIIAEDTNERENDVMWQYNLATGELVRILSSPYGAETTSPYWYPDIRGYNYLVGAIQHPYGESNQDDISDTDATGPYGYIGVWPIPVSNFNSGERLQLVGIPYAATAMQKHSVLSANQALQFSDNNTQYIVANNDIRTMERVAENQQLAADQVPFAG